MQRLGQWLDSKPHVALGLLWLAWLLGLIYAISLGG